MRGNPVYLVLAVVAFIAAGAKLVDNFTEAETTIPTEAVELTYFATDQVLLTEPERLQVIDGILIVNADGQGSCVVVGKRSGWWYAVTAKHVVSMGPSLSVGPPFPGYPVPVPASPTVITVGPDQCEVEIVRMDSQMDLAMIRFRSETIYRVYETAKAVDGGGCRVVGWVRGTLLSYRGHVSGITEENIFTNTGVFPGCSGGALLNDQDELIGVPIAAAMYQGMVFDSTAICVPPRYIDSMLETIAGE